MTVAQEDSNSFRYQQARSNVSAQQNQKTATCKVMPLSYFKYLYLQHLSAKTMHDSASDIYMKHLPLQIWIHDQFKFQGPWDI